MTMQNLMNIVQKNFDIICKLLWRRSACISAQSDQGICSNSVVSKKAELAESKFSGP